MAKDLDFTTKSGALSRQTAFCFDPFALVIVEEDPTHPLFDERATQSPPESFINSVIVSGVVTSIEVRKAGEKKGIAVNEVVDGRQRVQGARIATTRMLRFAELAKKGAPMDRIAKEFGIDVETAEIWLEAFKDRSWERYTVNGVRVSGNAQKMRTLVVELNEQRVEDGPLVKAKKYARLLENGVQEHRARIAAGVSKSQAKGYLALLECSAPVQRAVELGKVAATVATKLAALAPEEQPRALEEMIAAGATKGHAAKRAVEQAARGEKVTREKPQEYLLAGVVIANGSKQEEITLRELKGPRPKGAKLRVLRAWVVEA